jgi:fatty-acyl-CoA synthase
VQPLSPAPYPFAAGHSGAPALGPMPAIAERRQALRHRYPAWRPRTLDQMLDATAQEFPDRAYIVTDDRSWTYREIARWSERIASGLVAAGVQPGDHVALLLANYAEFVAVKFAIARAGAVAVPINFLNRKDELGYVLRQSDAVLLITMDRFRDLDYLAFLDQLEPGWERPGGGSAFPRLGGVVVFQTGNTPPRPGITRLAEFGADAGPWQPIAHPGANSNADIIYTSGTTGSPKGVMLTHDMALRAAFASCYSRAFEDGRRILFSLPMYHVFGYIEGLLTVMFVGGAVVPQLKFDAPDTLRAMTAHRASDALLIPAMTLALLDELKQPGARHDLSSLHSVLASGGRAPAYIWQEIYDHMHVQEVTTGYGMTEVTASATMTLPEDPMERLLASNGRLRDVGPAGDPDNDGLLVSYRVIDPESGMQVAPGQVGELQARGKGVTAGYYNKPEASADAFTADGWLHTGDLGRIDTDGYLTLVGRLKESYRCGGEQVLPTETEDLLVTHPAVIQAHVVPVPDLRMGEVGVAFVVLREQPKVTPQELVAFCADHLARFKVPRHVLQIRADDIPRGVLASFS